MRAMRRLGAAGVVALSLVLAGCTGDGDPDPPATSSSPPTSPSPTETVALPVMPEEAKAETDRGAMAFVEHWFAVVNYGYRTGDTAPLRALSPPECDDCFQYIDLIEQLTSDGARVGGDPIVVETVNAPPPTDGVVVVRMTYHQPVLKVISETDEPAPSLTSVGTSVLETALEWKGESWTVLGFGT